MIQNICWFIQECIIIPLELLSLSLRHAEACYASDYMGLQNCNFFKHSLNIKTVSWNFQYIGNITNSATQNNCAFNSKYVRYIEFFVLNS